MPAIGLGESGAAPSTSSCFAILSSSSPLIPDIRKLVFKKGDGLDRGGEEGGLIFLHRPLSATCQPPCPFMDHPNNPSHLTKGLRSEQSRSKLAAPWLPGAMALGARVSENKDRILGAKGQGAQGQIQGSGRGCQDLTEGMDHFSWKLPLAGASPLSPEK